MREWPKKPPYLESRRLGIYALLSVYIGSGKTTGKRKLKHSLKKRCTRELWERDRRHHQTPLTKCGYCLVPEDVSLSMKMCAQRNAGRSRLYPSHGLLRCITSHSRFAPASTMRKMKRLRRRLVRLHQLDGRVSSCFWLTPKTLLFITRKKKFTCCQSKTFYNNLFLWYIEHFSLKVVILSRLFGLSFYTLVNLVTIYSR